MKTKLFCYHCDKEYLVSMTDILLMQLYAPQHLESEKLNYFYKDECFFTKLKEIKSIYLAQ